MKHRLMLLAAGIVLLFSTSGTYAFWFGMDFTNATLDLGNSSQINITNQYASAFRLEFSNAYRYIDDRDPYPEDFGMSNGLLENNNVSAQVGRMHFLDPQSYFELDVWTIDPNNIALEVYDANFNFLAYAPAFSTPYGTTLSWDPSFGLASYVDWHDDGGFVQIANVRYDLIPEPATLTLLGFGLVGLGAVRRRFRK